MCVAPPPVSTLKLYTRGRKLLSDPPFDWTLEGRAVRASNSP